MSRPITIGEECAIRLLHPLRNVRARMLHVVGGLWPRLPDGEGGEEARRTAHDFELLVFGEYARQRDQGACPKPPIPAREVYQTGLESLTRLLRWLDFRRVGSRRLLDWFWTLAKIRRAIWRQQGCDADWWEGWGGTLHTLRDAADARRDLLLGPIISLEERLGLAAWPGLHDDLRKGET